MYQRHPSKPLRRDEDRAVSNVDGGHKLNIASEWNLPALAPRRTGPFWGIVNNIYSNQIIRYRSGRRFNVIAGSDLNHDGNPWTDRPLGVGRNTFLGPRFARIDISVGTRFPIVENLRANVSVEVINVLNRTNFVSFNTVLNRPDLIGINPGIVLGREMQPGYDFEQPLLPNGFGIATLAAEPRRATIRLRFHF
jgi:hypothetical protein